MESIGIVIHTALERYDLLAITINTIVQGEYPARIAVVCTGNEKLLISALKYKDLFEVILFKPVDTGPAYALNMGLNYFRSTCTYYQISVPQIIGFSNDDMLFRRGWLKELMRMREDAIKRDLGAEIFSPQYTAGEAPKMGTSGDYDFYHTARFVTAPYLLEWQRWKKLRPEVDLRSDSEIGRRADWDLLYRNEKARGVCGVLKKGWVAHLGAGKRASFGRSSPIGIWVSDEQIKEMKDRILAGEEPMTVYNSVVRKT